MFALELLKTDASYSGVFRKQYLTGKKILKSYKVEVLNHKISDFGSGKYFNIDTELSLTADNSSLSMINEVIRSFQSSSTTINDGVYNPNQKTGIDAESLLEKNIGNSLIKIDCLNGKKKVIYSGEQTFKVLFSMKYKNEADYNPENSYKSLFNKNQIIATVTLPSIPREIVKNISKIDVRIK